MAKTPEKIIDNQMQKLERDYNPNSDPDTYLKQVKTRAERREQNKSHREFTEQMDLSAQDNHMKYERPQFTVVTASEAYREGWERIFGEDQGSVHEHLGEPGDSSDG